MLKTCIILGSFGVLLVAGLPAPQDEYADEYADEEVCLTSKDSKASEKECVFPFTFNNFTYNGCPTDPTDETKTKRWCSTKVDETGKHIAGGDDWGYCTEGCTPEIFPDEFVLGSDAGEAASDACDWTACNGFTLKINVFEKEETYGQCQHPAGNDGSEDDFFCFVNADSNCADKTIYDEENNLFVSSTACKDPRAPLPRAFSISFGGGRRRNSFSRGSSSYGRNRYGSSSSSYGGNSYGSNRYGSNRYGNNNNRGNSGGFNAGAFASNLGAGIGGLAAGLFGRK